LALNSPFFSQFFDHCSSKVVHRTDTAVAAAAGDDADESTSDCRRVTVDLTPDKLVLVNPRVFDKVLDFVYTGKIELDSDDVEDVYAASMQLSIDDLSAVSIDYMIATLSAENCVQYWTFAESGLIPAEEELTKVTSASFTALTGDAQSPSKNDESTTSSGVDDVGGSSRAIADQRSEKARLADACCQLVQSEFDRLAFRQDFGKLTIAMIKSVMSGSKLCVRSEVHK
jgi:hypothetical protein